MALYEYKCEKCDNTFDILKSISNRDTEEKCPKCNAPAKRIPFSPNIGHIYKGTGFYSTDYKESK